LTRIKHITTKEVAPPAELHPLRRFFASEETASSLSVVKTPPVSHRVIGQPAAHWSEAIMWSVAEHVAASVAALLNPKGSTAQAMTTTEAATTAAAALLAVYASYKIISGVVEEWSIQRALSKQGLYRPSSTLPILGNTLDVMVYHKHRFHDWMTDQSRITGGKPWVLSIIGRPTTIVFTSPEACEDIFKTQFEVFEKGEELIDLGHDVFGDGIVGVDGHKWLQQRRTASHLFSMQMLRDVMDDVVMEKTEKLCEVLSACARSGKPVGMKSLLSKFTSDVFTKVGFGVDLQGLEKSLEGDVEAEHPFIQAVADYGPLIQARAHSPTWFWKLKRFFNIGDERQFKKSANVVQDLIHDIMVESLANKAKNNGDTKPRRDLLTLFVDSSGTNDAMVVRDIVMNFFFAGKDTTSFSMSWFLVMMNRHPRVLRKIREEIRTNLPDLGTRVPTMEELSKLPYLEAAIKESLRLYMTAIHRTPNRSTTLSDGTFVPLGTYAIVSAYASARMASVWGPDAEEYRPERFIDEDIGKLKVVSPFKFISFIGGPRQCLGIRFAMLEMKTAMATLMNRFDLETVEDPFSITYDFSLVLPVKGDLIVNVRE
jgi:cytochrome P450